MAPIRCALAAMACLTAVGLTLSTVAASPAPGTTAGSRESVPGVARPLIVTAEPIPGSAENGPPPSSPPPGKRAVTLSEALAAADAVPEVVVARAEEQAAHAGIGVAGAGGAVTVGVATHTVSAQFSPFVAYTLRWAGQRSAAVDAARADLAAAMGSSAAVLAAARRSVRGAWISLAVDEQLARIASERAERAEKNRDAVAALYEQGRVPRLDLARAETESTLARSAAERDEATRATAAAALGALLGEPNGADLATGGEVPSPEVAGPLEEWITRAASTSPDVVTQQNKVLAAQARVKLAERQRLPGITLELGADYYDPTQPGIDAHAGVAFAIPLDGSAKTELASAELTRETSELERVKRAAAARAEAAWRASAASRRTLQTIETTAIPAAREAADLTRLAYQEGKVDLFRLLDAERALSETEAAKWEAFDTWGMAWADLLWFSGEMP